ncbi:hypothetical protein [Dyella sp. A6]|uniref:hypothetical protein n=1 Tax=Dyella aluminiiresistens TaxID=3069105 RepID=UPI002E7A9F20|nr:hypothetical protein [Dyella sp. A6]
MSEASFLRSDKPLKHWTLRARQQHTLRQLLDGTLAPLQGFLGRTDYDCVLRSMQLRDGTPWAWPVTLDVDEAFAATLDRGERIGLCDALGTVLAELDIDDIYFPDHLHEARSLYGSMSRHHPAIVELLQHTGPVYLGGRITGLDDRNVSSAPRAGTVWAFAPYSLQVAGEALAGTGQRLH